MLESIVKAFVFLGVISGGVLAIVTIGVWLWFMMRIIDEIYKGKK